MNFAKARKAIVIDRLLNAGAAQLGQVSASDSSDEVVCIPDHSYVLGRMRPDPHRTLFVQGDLLELKLIHYWTIIDERQQNKVRCRNIPLEGVPVLSSVDDPWPDELQANPGRTTNDH